MLPALRKELEKLDSWRATIPGAGRQLVSLRELGDPGLLVLHPVGALQVSQRFVPLNLPLDKVGNQKPSDITKATVTVDAGSVLAVRGPVRERFAAAQYRDDGRRGEAVGARVRAARERRGARRCRQRLDHRTVGHRGRSATRRSSSTRPSSGTRSGSSSSGPSCSTTSPPAPPISKSPLSLAQEKKHQPFAAKVEVTGEQFTVAHQADNTAVAGVQTFASHAEAMAHVAGAVAADPALADAFHVIPLRGGQRRRMSEQPIASYSFLPWARQGLGGQVQEADQAVVPAIRATIGVTLTINADKVGGGTTTEQVPRNVEMYGPGDVIGIDAASIVRSEPRHWITNFETNYLPFVEFYEEDFPWRYTPAKSSDGGRRMRPWLTLVVLAEDEFVDRATQSGGKLPVIEATDAAGTFPDVGDPVGLGPRARQRRARRRPGRPAGERRPAGRDGRGQPRLGVLAPAQPAGPPRQHRLPRVRHPVVRERAARRPRQGPGCGSVPHAGLVGPRPHGPGA